MNADSDPAHRNLRPEQRPPKTGRLAKLWKSIHVGSKQFNEVVAAVRTIIFLLAAVLGVAALIYSAASDRLTWSPLSALSVGLLVAATVLFLWGVILSFRNAATKQLMAAFVLAIIAAVIGMFVLPERPTIVWRWPTSNGPMHAVTRGTIGLADIVPDVDRIKLNQTRERNGYRGEKYIAFESHEITRSPKSITAKISDIWLGVYVVRRNASSPPQLLPTISPSAYLPDKLEGPVQLVLTLFPLTNDARESVAHPKEQQNGTIQLDELVAVEW